MFLVYLKSQSETETHGQNVYGIYAGKTYQKDYETFPVCVGKHGDIVTEGKFYKTRRVAENAAKKLIKKCSFISSYQIVEFSGDELGEKECEI